MQINKSDLDNDIGASAATSYEITCGDKMYILGWAISTPGGSSLDKVFYKNDDGKLNNKDVVTLFRLK